MQQPLEDRVTSVEAAAARHEQRLARLDAMIARLDASIADHRQHLARLDAMIADHDQLFDRILAIEERLDMRQEELERDAAVTRRLWLRLAQRYGWLDDEQNGAQPDTPA